MVAGTLARAEAVIEELGLNGVALANNADSARGCILDAVVVDDTALPLKADVRSTLGIDSVGRMYALVRLT